MHDIFMNTLYFFGTVVLWALIAAITIPAFLFAVGLIAALINKDG